MDEREYRNTKARIAYREYQKQQPHCDKCNFCMVFKGRTAEQRACTAVSRLVDNRVVTSPEWCPKKGVFNE